MVQRRRAVSFSKRFSLVLPRLFFDRPTTIDRTDATFRNDRREIIVGCVLAEANAYVVVPKYRDVRRDKDESRCY